MSEGSGQPQRYCGNCGTEIRSGISFCVSCGRPVNGGPASPGPDNPVPPPTPSRPLADTLKETFQGLTGRFSNARSASSGASLGRLPNKAINWFKDLPSVPKLIIVGLLLLLLLTILSPVARVVAIIVFVVSAVVLAIRLIQRRPLRGWVVAVVGSLALIPVFGGVSGAIYGGDSGSSEAGESESLYDTSASPSASNSGGSEPYGNVAPGLEEAAKEWASEAPKGGYILVPGYLPFEVESYTNYLDPNNLMYGMHSDATAYLEIEIRDPSNYALYEVDGTIQIDGRSYSYSEISLSACQLHLWETSGGPQAFYLYFPTGGPMMSCMAPEELVRTLESMVRVEGTDGKDR